MRHRVTKLQAAPREQAVTLDELDSYRAIFVLYVQGNPESRRLPILCHRDRLDLLTCGHAEARRVRGHRGEVRRGRGGCHE